MRAKLIKAYHNTKFKKELDLANFVSWQQKYYMLIILEIFIVYKYVTEKRS